MQAGLPNRQPLLKALALKYLKGSVMKLINIIFISLLIGCAEHPIKESAPDYIKITEAHRDEIGKQSELGAAIYQKDKLAASATDYLFQKGILPNDTRPRGWVVDISDGAQNVYFMGPSKSGIKSYHALTYKNKSWSHNDSPNTKAVHQSMFKARQIASQNIKIRCSERYNTVVLSDEGYWLVYLLASTTDPDSIVVGGHNLVKINKNTFEVVNAKALSKSCLNLPKGGGGIPYTTHIVDDIPIAVHSFLSLLHQTNLYVGTKTGPWKIENGTISSIK